MFFINIYAANTKSFPQRKKNARILKLLKVIIKITFKSHTRTEHILKMLQFNSTAAEAAERIVAAPAVLQQTLFLLKTTLLYARLYILKRYITVYTQHEKSINFTFRTNHMRRYCKVYSV